MDLGGFIDTYRDAIAKRMVESYPPLYRPSGNGHTLPKPLRSTAPSHISKMVLPIIPLRPTVTASSEWSRARGLG